MTKDPAENNVKITDDLVKNVARLSRLYFSDEDAVKYGQQMSQIIAYIAQLNEVDTSSIQPTSYVLPSMKNVFREDNIRQSLPVEEALNNAPDKQGDFFRVPRVI